MNENELLPERKLHRLKSWDYSQNGYYFITVCTKDKKQLLAKERTLCVVLSLFLPENTTKLFPKVKKTSFGNRRFMTK